MFGDKRKNNGGAREGAGRKPGISNKSTVEFRNYVRTFTREAANMFVAMMRNKDADARLRLKAARWLVERGYGKTPIQIFEPEAPATRAMIQNRTLRPSGGHLCKQKLAPTRSAVDAAMSIQGALTTFRGDPTDRTAGG
jgi:uncharacterized MAPEG superfamily protein